MSGDDLLEQLGRLGREREAPDPLDRLEAHAAGDLPQDEAEALAARSDTWADAVAAAEPIGKAQQNEVIGEILEARRSASTAPPPWWRRLLEGPRAWAVPGGLAAAALALVLIVPRGPTLPTYSARVGDLADTQSVLRWPVGPDGQPLRAPRSPLMVTLVPEAAAEVPIGARAFAVGGARVRAVELSTEVSPRGALRAHILGAEDIAGAEAVVFLVAEEGHVPGTIEACSAPSCRTVRVPVAFDR